MKKLTLLLFLAALFLGPVAVQASEDCPAVTFRDVTGAPLEYIELQVGQSVDLPLLEDEKGEPLEYRRFSIVNSDAAIISENQIVGLTPGQTQLAITVELGDDICIYDIAIVVYSRDPELRADCEEGDFWLNDEQIDAIRLNAGDVVDLPRLLSPTTGGPIKIDYTDIDDKNVAVWTASGQIQAVENGNTQLVMQQFFFDEAEPDYPYAYCEWRLDIIVGEAEQDDCPELSFLDENAEPIDFIELEVGQEIAWPQLVNAENEVMNPIRKAIYGVEVAAETDLGNIKALAPGQTALVVAVMNGEQVPCSYTLDIYVKGEPQNDCPEVHFLEVTGAPLEEIILPLGELLTLPLLVDADGNMIRDWEYDIPNNGVLLDTEEGIQAVEVGESALFAYFMPKGAEKVCEAFIPVIVKGPVTPIPETEETEFDFSVIGPDGNEWLSLSLAPTDNYNAEEGRLEIASTYSEEEINAALESAVPGSSAFKALLPSTLAFLIPEGEGDIEIECELFPGFSLQVKIGNEGSATATVGLDGKARLHYETTEEVYVIVYLNGAPESAPGRIRKATQEGIGVYIYNLKVTPKNAETGIEEIRTNENSSKVLFNGQLYILRDGKMYNAVGTQVR